MGVMSLSRALRLVAAPRTVEAPMVMAVAMETTEDFMMEIGKRAKNDMNESGKKMRSED